MAFGRKSLIDQLSGFSAFVQNTLSAGSGYSSTPKIRSLGEITAGRHLLHAKIPTDNAIPDWKQS
jgi:hypothetical protein